MEIYIIEIMRDDHTEIAEVYFNSEREAINWLIKKYGQWIDPNKLYIYYSGLWRFRKGKENSIRFSVRSIKAA